MYLFPDRDPTWVFCCECGLTLPFVIGLAVSTFIFASPFQALLSLGAGGSGHATFSVEGET